MVGDGMIEDIKVSLWLTCDNVILQMLHKDCSIGNTWAMAKEMKDVH